MALTETTHAGDFILSMANGNQSVDEVTLISGQDLEAGAVLGLITASGKYTEWATGASDGSEDAAAILLAKGDATDGDLQVTAVTRNAEVNGNQLMWPDESPPVDQDAGAESLAEHGIIVR